MFSTINYSSVHLEDEVKKEKVNSQLIHVFFFQILGEMCMHEYWADRIVLSSCDCQVNGVKS